MFTHYKERMVKEFECYGSTCAFCGHDCGRQYAMLRHMATVHGLAQRYYQEEVGGGEESGEVTMGEVEKRPEDKLTMVEVKDKKNVRESKEERTEEVANDEAAQKNIVHGREGDSSEEKMEEVKEIRRGQRTS